MLHYSDASDYLPLNCLANSLCSWTSKEISKSNITARCEGNPPEIGEFQSQRTSNAKNVSKSLCHRVAILFGIIVYSWIFVIHFFIFFGWPSMGSQRIELIHIVSCILDDPLLKVSNRSWILCLITGSKRSVSCQFDNRYICGYDTHQYTRKHGIWIWKNDGGFKLQDGTRAKGILIFISKCNNIPINLIPTNLSHKYCAQHQ